MISSVAVGMAYTAAAVFCAAVVRGASGFGFSMITVATLTLLYTPAEITPVILLWEVAASAGLLPFVWRQVNWRVLRDLGVGVLPGTPVGVYCLASVPADIMKAVINVVVLVFTALIFKGFRLQRTPGRVFTGGVGVLTGIINGASANGGPPVILFFLSGPSGAAVSRASLIAFFLIIDIFALFVVAFYNLITPAVWMMAASYLPCMFLGLWLGARWFTRMDDGYFRRVVLLFLMAVSVFGLVQSARDFYF